MSEEATKPDTDVRPPSKIGKYIIKRTMGEGAMGEVLEGFDPIIERRVAIKRLHTRLIESDNTGQFLERFKQEAQAAARCSHSNIVTILEYGEHDNAPYIVMEYVDGVDLQTLIRKRRLKKLKNVIGIVGQTVKALQTAHEHGVVHRDIKPANIIIMKNGTVKLADFGIARVPVDKNLTQVGVAIGTPRYMSPEQAMAHPTDHRTDLYALTMIFAQMLTEIRYEESIACDVLPEIPGISKSHYVNHREPVPIPFIPLIIKGLAFDPDQRIRSADEYIDRLKSAVKALKTESSTASVNTNRRASDRIPPPAPVDPIELESLQLILSDYIGPIARNVIENEAPQYREPSELARAVATEIPDQDEREAFLRDWESKSGQSIATKKQQEKLEATTGGVVPPSNYLSDKIRQKLEKSFAQFVGPMSGRLINIHVTKCHDLKALIHSLGDEIPDVDDKSAFARQWAKALG